MLRVSWKSEAISAPAQAYIFDSRPQSAVGSRREARATSFPRSYKVFIVIYAVYEPGGCRKQFLLLCNAHPSGGTRAVASGKWRLAGPGPGEEASVALICHFARMPTTGAEPGSQREGEGSGEWMPHQVACHIGNFCFLLTRLWGMPLFFIPIKMTIFQCGFFLQILTFSKGICQLAGGAEKGKKKCQKSFMAAMTRRRWLPHLVAPPPQLGKP